MTPSIAPASAQQSPADAAAHDLASYVRPTRPVPVDSAPDADELLRRALGQPARTFVSAGSVR